MEIYTGEDLSVCAQARFEQNEHTLDDYEVEVMVKTTPLGTQFTASTLPGACSQVKRGQNNGFGFNLPASVTAQMTPGEVVIEVLLTHKQTGARVISEHRNVVLKESKIGRAAKFI